MSTLAELMEVYPDAAPAARRGIKARLKHIQSQIASLSEFRDAWVLDINKMHFKAQPAMIKWLDERIEGYRAEYEKEVKKHHYELQWLDHFEKGMPESPTGGVADEQIERAKQVPIETILDVTRHYARCPFHNDRHPSMYVYKDNHAYCFACNSWGDVIDIYMKLNGVDFLSAVKTLAP